MKDGLGFWKKIAGFLFVFLFFLLFQKNILEVKAAIPDGSGARSYTNTTSGDVFLGGKYIEIGITREGSLGTVSVAPTEALPVADDVTGREIYFHPSVFSSNKIGMVTNADENGSEEGWNSITCDYFLPGLINEAWMIGWNSEMKARGCTSGSDAQCVSSGILSSNTVNKSTESLLCAETTIITQDNIRIIQNISFKPEDKNFQAHVEITNLGEDDLTNVRFMRAFDPDQGRLTSTDTAATRNVIGHEDLDASGVSVIAYKTDGTAPFIYFTADERAVAGWSRKLFTTVYGIESEIASGIVSITPGTEYTADGNIFLYYDFPTLNSGETVEISYFSSLDTNLESAIEGILGLDISNEELDVEIANENSEKVSAFVSATITGVDISTCTVSYKWYISQSQDVTDSGKIISGADTGKYVFVPTGNREDAGVYYLCCAVTATSGEQTVTKCSKNLKITVYNRFDLCYDSNGGTGSVSAEKNIREGESGTVAEGNVLTPPTGRHFKSWNTKADGSGISYQPGDKLIMTDAVTLFAQWELDSWEMRAKIYLDEEEIKDNHAYQFYMISEDKNDPEIELSYQGNYWTANLSPEYCKVLVYVAGTKESVGETESYEVQITPYKAEIHLYTIHWDTDGDGIENESSVLLEGMMPAHADGYKPETDGYFYDFTGWDKELSEVTGEETYTARFEENVKKYMIEWDIDGDGVADAAEQVDYGAMPDHHDIDKAADEKYTYTFLGWTPKVEKVTKDQLYSAVFDKILNQYTVIWSATRIGYEIIPEEGSKNVVPYNGSYSFRVKEKPGYDSSTLVVTANGKVITPVDGVYTVSSIGLDGRNVKMQAAIADYIPPTGKISVHTDSWTALQKNISFDKFYTTMQEVKIEAEDVGGGVQTVSYCISKEPVAENKLEALEWIPYVRNFYLYPDMRGIIYAKIVDVEGNVTYLSSCGLVIEAKYDAKDIWKYEQVTKLEDYIYRQKTDDDMKGSLYNKVRARVISQKETQQTLQWNKVTDADGYIIYGNKCGQTYKKLKTIKNPKTTKWIKKKLKKGTYYKYMVVAYKVIDGKKKVLSVSKTVHAITAGGKYKNPKGVRVKQKSIKLKVGKKKKIQAVKVMPKGGKMREHVNRFRYESSNKRIATIDKKGKVCGKNPGTCYVFVYVQNGIYQMINVKVEKP